MCALNREPFVSHMQFHTDMHVPFGGFFFVRSFVLVFNFYNVSAPVAHNAVLLLCVCVCVVKSQSELLINNYNKFEYRTVIGQ